MSRSVTRLLFIGPDHATAVGGREQLSRLHRQALGDLFGDRLETLLLPRRPLAGGAALRAVFNGRIDGTDLVTEQRILATISDRSIDQVWLDGSNLGVLARAIKRRYPEVEVTTFFHNVEPRFFLGAFRWRPGPRALGVVAANYVAERLAVRASDRRVALNRRDSDLLQRLYGFGATDRLPMAIPAPAKLTAANCPPPVAGEYLLFVGGGFYANQDGITWYAANVAPRIGLPTYVVGRGLEPLQGKLSRTGNVHLVGAVDDLGPWYHHAKAVVAPIFDGSGMKTKVAEAMMHGKRIAGTIEAFNGYDNITDDEGWRCDTADEFVTVLKRVEEMALPRFDPALRLRFERLYSYEAARTRLAAILAVPLSKIEN